MPRVLAWLAARSTSINWLQYAIPLLSAVVCCAGVAVNFAAAKRLPWKSNATPWAAAVAIAPLVVPHTGEVYLNITNLQWLMAPTIISLLYLAPSLRGAKALAAVVAIELLALSGPFSVLLLPFAVALVALRHKRGASFEIRAIYAAYILASLYQALVIFFSMDDAKAEISPAPVDLLNVAASDLLGPAIIPPQAIAVWEYAVVAASIGLILAILLPLIRSQARLEVAVLLGFSAAVWAAAAIKIGGDFQLRWDGNGARYTFIPYVLLMWTLLIAAGTSANWAQYLPLIFCSAMVSVSASKFVHGAVEPTKVEKTKDGYVVLHPPGWRDELKAKRVKIRP